jgi:hypothetical protein
LISRNRYGASSEGVIISQEKDIFPKRHLSNPLHILVKGSYVSCETDNIYLSFCMCDEKCNSNLF